MSRKLHLVMLAVLCAAAVTAFGRPAPIPPAHAAPPASSGASAAGTESTAALRPLREWSAAAHRWLAAGALDAPTVEHQIVALRKAVGRAASTLRAASPPERKRELARMRQRLDDDLRPARRELRGDRRRLFFLALQGELERLARRGGLDQAPTGAPTTNPPFEHNPSRMTRALAPDADADGTIDAVDRDDDGDGSPDATDPTDLGWGIPDALRVRGGGREGSAYDVSVTEDVPDVRTVAALRATPTPAAQRRGRTCGRLTRWSGPRRKRLARGPSLSRVGVRVQRARITNGRLTFKLRARSRVKLCLAVRGGTPRVRPVVVRAPKGRRVIRERLPSVPTSRPRDLRVYAVVPGRRIGRGKGRVVGRGDRRLRVLGPCERPNADFDGDGVPDCDELAGFDLTLYEPAGQCVPNPQPVPCRVSRQVHVTSDPNDPNTDDDAVTVPDPVTGEEVTFELTDGDEWRLAASGGVSNPASVDTDGDGLGDVEELLRYGTSAVDPDTDADSADVSTSQAPNPELFDKAEIDGGAIPDSRHPSSPVSDDTDGDDRPDLAEFETATNPLVAQVPSYALRIKPGSSLNIAIPFASGEAFTEALAVGTESVSGTEDTRVKETTRFNRTEISGQLSGGVEGGVEGKAPSVGMNLGASAGFTYEFGKTTTDSHTTAFTTESRENVQREFAQLEETTRAERGEVSAIFEVTNVDPTTSITLKDLSVNVTFLCQPVARINFECEPGLETPLGAALTREEDADLELAAAGAAGATKQVELSTDGIPAGVIETLSANPSNLSFTPDAFIHRGGEEQSLNDTIGTTIPLATAGLTIDDGAGNVLAYSIAAQFEHEWGRPAPSQGLPVSIERALDLVEMPYDTFEETYENPADPEGPVDVVGFESLGGPGSRLPSAPQTQPVEAGKADGAWIVLGDAAEGFNPAADPNDPLDPVVPDVTELALGTGDQVSLAYLSDGDGDGLFDRVEDQLDTSDTEADSDSDGATAGCPAPGGPDDDVRCPPAFEVDGDYPSDFFETLVGWQVDFPQGSDGYHTLSNPAQCDPDGDGAPDGPDSTRQTCQSMTSDAEEEGWDELGRSTDPLNPDTNGDQLPDGADDNPLGTPRRRGPVFAEWTAQDLTGGVLNSDNATRDLRSAVATITAANPGDPSGDTGIELCGPDPQELTPSGKSCAGSTGYYRVSWMLSGETTPATPYARFRIGADAGNRRETLLDAFYDPREADGDEGTEDLYFRVYEPRAGVRFQLLGMAGASDFPLRVSEVTVEPVSGAEFLDAGASEDFQAIALPGRMLAPSLPASEEGQSASIDAPAGASGFTTVSGGGIIGMPETTTSPTPGTQFRARVGLRRNSTNTSSDEILASAAVFNQGQGVGTPLAPTPAGAPLFDATASATPLAQAHVYGGDIQTPGATSYFNLLAHASDASALGFPLAVAPGAEGLWLDNVTLDAVEAPNGVSQIVGGPEEPGDPARAAESPWAGVGFPPAATSSFEAISPNPEKQVTRLAAGGSVILDWTNSNPQMPFPELPDADDLGAAYVQPIRITSATQPGTDDDEIPGSGRSQSQWSFAVRAREETGEFDPARCDFLPLDVVIDDSRIITGYDPPQGDEEGQFDYSLNGNFDEHDNLSSANRGSSDELVEDLTWASFRQLRGPGVSHVVFPHNPETDDDEPVRTQSAAYLRPWEDCDGSLPAFGTTVDQAMLGQRQGPTAGAGG